MDSWGVEFALSVVVGADCCTYATCVLRERGKVDIRMTLCACLHLIKDAVSGRTRLDLCIVTNVKFALLSDRREVFYYWDFAL